jgi:hypothetical protein
MCGVVRVVLCCAAHHLHTARIFRRWLTRRKRTPARRARRRPQRIGPQHQAGSDSLLTSLTFLKLAKKFFSGVEGASKHMGVLYGLGVDGADLRPPE